ncbi:hypothetical protein D6D02_01089 [Aureobasidium pullulans]|nr:hypothetical protein D6D02_01089 [Aureobasidium pullulans]THZ04767.1 hypothetical protein D6C93_02288 [Aureobasidium pullulans]
MTIVHIVLFKFRPEVTDEHKQKFVTELKKLKSLPCSFSVTSTYMFPYKEDLMRYDFEVDEADEHLLGFLPLVASKIN